jgi:hypothetical protein
MDTTRNTRWIRLVDSSGYDSIYVVIALHPYSPYALPGGDPQNPEVRHG